MNIDNDKLTEDPISLIAEIVHGALWSIYYHEKEMNKANLNLSNTKAFMQRSGFEDSIPDGVTADSIYEGYFENVERFAQSILAHFLDSLEHHENGLESAHQQLAHVKIMLARGRYTEININEIQKEIERKHKDQE